MHIGTCNGTCLCQKNVDGWISKLIVVDFTV